MIASNYVLTYLNTTYDLFLIVLARPQAVQKDPGLFYTIFAIEIINLLISACIFLPIVFAMNKFYHYHLNLIRLAQIYLTSYYLDIIARLITLSYEIGWLEMTGTLPEDIILLVANMARITFTAQYCCLIPAMLSERAFATYFLEDYESRKRRWIAFGVYGISISYSAFGAYRITSGNLSFSHIIVIFGIITIGMVAFVIFYRYNKRKLHDLSGHYRSTNRYTLTVRYQVTENLKVLKNILTMSVVMAMFLLVAAILVYIMFFVYEFFSLSWQITTAILEMWIAFSANAITVSLFILNKNWSNTTMVHLFRLRDNVRVTTMTIDKPQQTDVYFSYLAKQCFSVFGGWYPFLLDRIYQPRTYHGCLAGRPGYSPGREFWMPF